MHDLDPNRYFASTPGDDGVLISRREIRAWLARIAEHTDRLRVRTLGISTEGRPIEAIFIAADLGGDRLDTLLDCRRTWVDALLRGDADPARQRPIALITSGIHATEVGGPQSIPQVVYSLVTGETPAIQSIRERVLTVIVPTLNPDGMDLVQRWHDTTHGTSQAGSLPPLLYHRHAGHDNNRDWLFRNLTESRIVLDTLYGPLLPHVTLDQHQMHAHGPRFVLPPYTNPWEPHVHPHIVAASNALGQAIAADLTLAGMSGVTTGQYFDAWEPSRAMQHYRGGIRILAEAASARLAWPIDISDAQLAATPLAQPVAPTTSMPHPWPAGTWRLRDIVRYHQAAALSLLGRVAVDHERWDDIQRTALTSHEARRLLFAIPHGSPAPDRAANQRLAAISRQAGLAEPPATHADATVVRADRPLGPLAEAILLPKPYPEACGPSSYDVTTHHLPLMLGAVVTTGTRAETPIPADDQRWLAIDSRSHRAPELAELTARAGVPSYRTTTRTMTGDVLAEPGTWLVDRSSVPDAHHTLAHTTLAALPDSARPVQRRDLVLLDIGDQPTADHGWTRWWLEARAMPFLECRSAMLPALAERALTTTMLIADTATGFFTESLVDDLQRFMAAGGQIVAFGEAGRALACRCAAGVEQTAFPAGDPVRTPGALLRLLPTRDHPIALGLDRAIPAMFQRDGILRVVQTSPNVSVLARFAPRDTLLSGWMSDPGAVAGAPAVAEVRIGAGVLHAFAFRPLFRAQMLVTSPLVHNLIYRMEPPCHPHDRATTNAEPTSDPMS